MRGFYCPASRRYSNNTFSWGGGGWLQLVMIKIGFSAHLQFCNDEFHFEKEDEVNFTQIASPGFIVPIEWSSIQNTFMQKWRRWQWWWWICFYNHILSLVWKYGILVASTFGWPSTVKAGSELCLYPILGHALTIFWVKISILGFAKYLFKLCPVL